ncbi:initiation control protein YabA [Desulfofalx alkaliphila]|uniref:initiation control protein YabA n=1 Tax=Desulfofalx alkaliphila TaxID=105483 RepID=UPI000690BECA|nr:initiation control protein YabA [Desulfofalx alkaliphila]
MIKEVLGELEDIKKLVRLLEQENEKLRHELTQAYKHCKREAQRAAETEKTDRDEPTLLRLYNEGFHVCNIKFAQSREEECLFCLGLLRRQDDEVGEK